MIKRVNNGSTDVEMEAVKMQGMAAIRLARQAPLLKTELRTPILVMTPEGKLKALTDNKGLPVTVSATIMDSGIMAAIAKASDTSSHSSQGVKIAAQTFGFAKAALNPALTFGIAHQALKYGTGSNNSKNYNSSFNNPSQSPQTVDNIAAHADNTITDSHESRKSSTTELPACGQPEPESGD